MTTGGAVAEAVAVDDLWRLDARPELLDAAAGVWRATGQDAAAALAGLAPATRAVTGSAWAGDAADTYEWHRRKLDRDLDTVARCAPVTADRFEAMAALLRRGQNLLDDAWRRIAALVPHRRTGGGVTFSPVDQGQADAVRLAVADAAAIRSEVVQALLAHDAALRAARPQWAVIGTGWHDVAVGRVNGWRPAAEPASGVDVLMAGGNVVVNAGAGHDVVTVRTEPDGSRLVLVGGVPVRVPAGARLVVRTGTGNDTVHVDGAGSVTVLGGAGDDTLGGGDGNDTLLAGAGKDAVDAGGGDDLVSLGPGDTQGAESAALGAGDDRLWGSTGAARVDGGDGNDALFGGTADDVISAGGGMDTVDGGDGEDRISGNGGDDALFGGDSADHLDGGEGDDLLDGGESGDVLYGLSGRDTLIGGAGDDYLEGGAGDDALSGGTGQDVLSGGRGDDLLLGGTGDDVVYSGAGADTVLGGGGDDTLHGQGEDTAAGVERMVAVQSGGLDGFVRIEGDAEFVERVRTDLDLLSASPDGRAMLTALQATGTPLIIRPEAGDNGHASPGPTPVVRYNPAWGSVYGGRPPVVTLFHELAHVYDFTHGTFNTQPYNGASGRDVDGGGNPVTNYERQATGLPIDHDGDPATANRIDPRHPVELTENGLRGEMRLATRDTYGGP